MIPSFRNGQSNVDITCWIVLWKTWFPTANITKYLFAHHKPAEHDGHLRQLVQKLACHEMINTIKKAATVNPSEKLRAILLRSLKPDRRGTGSFGMPTSRCQPESNNLGGSAFLTHATAFCIQLCCDNVATQQPAGGETMALNPEGPSHDALKSLKQAASSTIILSLGYKRSEQQLGWYLKCYHQVFPPVNCWWPSKPPFCNLVAYVHLDQDTENLAQKY